MFPLPFQRSVVADGAVCLHVSRVSFGDFVLLAVVDLFQFFSVNPKEKCRNIRALQNSQDSPAFPAGVKHPEFPSGQSGQVSFLPGGYCRLFVSQQDRVRSVQFQRDLCQVPASRQKERHFTFLPSGGYGFTAHRRAGSRHRPLRQCGSRAGPKQQKQDPRYGDPDDLPCGMLHTLIPSRLSSGLTTLYHFSFFILH